MCLIGYDFLILDNAFLVHALHSKLVDKNYSRKRKVKIGNIKLYNRMKRELRKKYRGKHDC